jgi:signal transduction histidine kinase
VAVEGAPPGAAGVCGDGSLGRGGATRASAVPCQPREVDTLHQRQEVDQLRDRWSAIGHELRTPLNAILGHAGLLLEGVGGPLSAEARACLGDVQAAGHRLLQQIDWLLLLAQVEATAPRMDASVDLAGLIRTALQRCGPVAQGADAAFRVRGDAFWLEVLAGALAELCRDGSAHVPRLEVVLHPQREAGGLHLLSPRSAAVAAGPLPWRLIEVIAARHGAEVVATEQGLWLKWPETA